MAGKQSQPIQLRCMLAGREEEELAAELAQLQADLEDEQLLEAEGDFPATLAPPSRPHRDDEEDEDEEVTWTQQLAVF